VSTLLAPLVIPATPSASSSSTLSASFVKFNLKNQNSKILLFCFWRVHWLIQLALACPAPKFQLLFEVTHCLPIKFEFFLSLLSFFNIIETLLIQFLSAGTFSSVTFSWTTPWKCEESLTLEHKNVVQLNVILLNVVLPKIWINNFSIRMTNKRRNEKK
jgi:hypothetical protein